MGVKIIENCKWDTVSDKSLVWTFGCFLPGFSCSILIVDENKPVLCHRVLPYLLLGKIGTYTVVAVCIMGLNPINENGNKSELYMQNVIEPHFINRVEIP